MSLSIRCCWGGLTLSLLQCTSLFLCSGNRAYFSFILWECKSRSLPVFYFGNVELKEVDVIVPCQLFYYFRGWRTFLPETRSQNFTLEITMLHPLLPSPISPRRSSCAEEMEKSVCLLVQFFIQWLRNSRFYFSVLCPADKDTYALSQVLSANSQEIPFSFVLGISLSIRLCWGNGTFMYS